MLFKRTIIFRLYLFIKLEIQLKLVRHKFYMHIIKTLDIEWCVN